MRKEEKNQLIESLSEQLTNAKHVYLTDISNLNVETTHELRTICFKRDIKLMVVKNTLLKLAMEKSDKEMEPLYEILKGSTSLMFSDTGNLPAKVIKEFRKKHDRPLLKGAFVEEATYIGEDQLDVLFNIKSKNELIGDLIALLQSPAKNVIGALQSGGHTISGVLKTLSEKPE